MLIKSDLYIDIDNSSLHTELIDLKGQDQLNGVLPIIFLHEGLGSIEKWYDFPIEVCSRVNCPGVVYDRAGHGRSSHLKGKRTLSYLHEEAFILAKIFENQNIEKAILIGHSDGGSIALIFAALYPEKVAGVITEAAHVFVEDITIEGIVKTIEIFEKHNLKEKLFKYHGNKTEALFDAWANTWLSPEFRGWNIESVLSQIISPILVIQGEDDEYGTNDQVEAIAGQVKGPSYPLIIPDCGHIPHLQSKHIVLDNISNFIKQCLLFHKDQKSGLLGHDLFQFQVSV